MMDSAATAILSAFYPIVELCHHEFDEQAGCCRKCGAHTEEFTFVDKTVELDHSSSDESAESKLDYTK